MRNLPTDLLRTFVSVADLGSFSKAGAQLGRSQPAISLQIKRLEEIVDTKLLTRNDRQLGPTEPGEQLLNYARQMLRINDEAIAALTIPKVSGHIRLGIPNEFAISFLPQILGKFAQTHRDVSLEVTCELTTNLMQMLDDKQLDMVVAIHKPEDKPHKQSDEVWREDLVWVVAQDFVAQTDKPMPIVVAPQGCVYRHSMIQTLNSHAIPWRIVYTSTSYGGVRAAVMAGLGVTALAKSIVPESLKFIDAGQGFPPLPITHISLQYDKLSVTGALQHLIRYVLNYVEQRHVNPESPLVDINSQAIA